MIEQAIHKAGNNNIALCHEALLICVCLLLICLALFCLFAKLLAALCPHVSYSFAEFGVAPCSPGEVVGSRR